MRKPESDILLECLAQALETTAFLALEPLPADFPVPEEAQLFRLRFHGGYSGELSLAVPAGFGRLLAGNILAVEADDVLAVERAADAVKELVNMTVGGLLTRLSDSPDETMEMELPEALGPISPDQWRRLAEDGHTAAALAEGFPVLAGVAVKG